MANKSSIWDKCLDELKYQLKENEFTMWLRPLTAKVKGDTLELLAPNQYFVTHVYENHFKQIEALAIANGDNVIKRVVIQVESQLEPIYDEEITVNGFTASAGEALQDNQGFSDTDVESYRTQGQTGIVPQQMALDKSLSYLDDRFTFETFISGKSNSLAYRACLELGKKQPKNRHNPLFIYGASGLGKTHLMHSVAHRYLKLNKTFYYFSSEKFVNQLVYALRNQKVEQFKKKIKKVDLLIIDDIHVLAGKTKSSSEFLSLFVDFMTEDKQIILASDRHPSQMTEFDDRFRSHFSSGLSVAIEPPEMDTRMQILQKKAQLFGIELPKECALFIAQNVVSNVRSLEGALNQVMANANLTGRAVDLDMVRYALKDIIAIRSQAVSMDNIRKVVAEYYDVSVKEIMGKKRTRTIVRPRQIAMALARDLTKDSFPDIGHSFGGRDHTTVMHACDKVAQLRLEDPVLDREYQALSMTLQAG